MHQQSSKLNFLFKFNYCLTPSKVTQPYCVGLMHIKRQHRLVHNSVPLETPFASMLADKAGETTIWECADFFSQSEQASTMNESSNELKGTSALIVANFPISPENPFFNNLWDNASVRVCADGGANRLFALDKRRYVPDIITGDMDSAKSSVLQYYRNKGTVIVEKLDQNTTDLEKSILMLQELELRKKRKFKNITVMGGLGGNFTHELANVNILHKFSSRRIFLLSEQNLAFLLGPGHHLIKTNPDLCHTRRIFCGLLPLGSKCNNITTKGLKWDLKGASMGFGALVSTSNEMTGATAEVETSDFVLWTFDARPEEQQQQQEEETEIEIEKNRKQQQDGRGREQEHLLSSLYPTWHMTHL